MSFQKLIRFVNDEGKVLYGDIPAGISTENIKGTEVSIVDGDLEHGFSKTKKKAVVKQLLAPLPSAHIFVCIGLNYQQHAAEANLPIAPYPVVFTKPPDSIAGPYDGVQIHPLAQEMLDYEGELTVVIGRDGKNIPESEALDYVLGYTSGNDISARNFQLPNTSGGQYCYAKSFDGFAPVGPCIVSPFVIPDPQALSYTTKVNGSVRQQTPTSDMIWSVRQIIAHISRGTTLRKGTMIMTGTPSGVGLFMNPKGFLNSGDVVEVEIEKIGAIRNKMVFAN